MIKQMQLLKVQDEVFNSLYEVLPTNCVLTGGTALTRFYGFNHRFSEDIDLFFYITEGETHGASFAKVLNWVKGLKHKGFHIENVGVSDVSEGGNTLFHTAFIVFKNKTPLRLDFVEDVFSGCWLPQKLKTVDSKVKFRVDNIEAILHKKIYAVYSNYMSNKLPRGKDVVDLYVLLTQTFNLNDVAALYREERGISLPFNNILKILSESGRPDFSGILDLKPEIQAGTLDWLKSLQYFADKELTAFQPARIQGPH